MSDEKLYFRGTTFLLSYVWESRPKLEEYMLVECHEKGYVFQLVCISGYHAGALLCYISDDPDVVNARAVTYDYLYHQLELLFGEKMTIEVIHDSVRPDVVLPDTDHIVAEATPSRSGRLHPIDGSVISEKDIYFRGTTFVLSYVWESRPKRKEYMLVECHEKGYVFQLVCISGYDAGTIHCYITDDPDVVNAVAVTYDHLCRQLKSKVEKGMTLEAIYERPEAVRPDPS